MTRIFIAAVAAIIVIKVILGITGRFSPLNDYSQMGKLEKNLDYNDPFSLGKNNRTKEVQPKTPKGQDYFQNMEEAIAQNAAAVRQQTPGVEGEKPEAKKKKKTAAEIFQLEQKKLADAKKRRAKRNRMKRLAKQMQELEDQKRLDEENKRRLFEEWLQRQNANRKGPQVQPTVAPYVAAEAPAPAAKGPGNNGAPPPGLKRKGPFEPKDIDAWAEKLTKEPTVQDARAFIALYFTGEITREDFYRVLLQMQQSPNAQARRFAVMGAGLQQNPEAFTILAEITFGDNSPEVLEAANKSLANYRSVGSLSILSSTLSLSQGSLATRLRAIDLVAEVAQLFQGGTSPADGRDAFRPLIPVLEGLAKESNPEVKSRAEATLNSIRRILGTV